MDIMETTILTAIGTQATHTIMELVYTMVITGDHLIMTLGDIMTHTILITMDTIVHTTVLIMDIILTMEDITITIIIHMVTTGITRAIITQQTMYLATEDLFLEKAEMGP